MPHKYKLIYFNARGRAEGIRIAFAVAGQEFEDVRLSREEWPKYKEERGLNQVPALEVDGKLYPQSSAIARFVCRELGLYGSNNLEALQIDVVCEHLRDLGEKVIRFYFEKDEKVKEALQKEFFETFAPKILGQLEKILIENNGGDGFMVGDKLSMADIGIFSSITDGIERFKSGILADYPKLTGLVSRVQEIPNLKNYLETRPKE
ncbi:S-crystallin SL11 [Holothuria leucospilota]|uniref:S-crystallin SL11 n=1 Tax=Holothuria leucospilota TaxID=206669 RepID=A0A9Q1C9M1_HOLLE|nr:S-crystallin SL11 [Holothuria leucospilota]